MVYLPTGRSDLILILGCMTSKFLVRNLTSVSNVCEAASISLFWVPNGLNELPEVCFANHDEYSNRGWYTGEQGIWRCLADRLNQSLVSPVAQDTEMPSLLYT